MFLKLIFISLIIILNSCGIYNLELNIKNPLQGANIFSPLSEKNFEEADVYECELAIDEEEWLDAVNICSQLEMNDYNKGLYASAIHAKNGGDLFNLIDASNTDLYDSVVEGYTLNLKGSNDNTITELESAIDLLISISVKTNNDYFQISFIYFTTACAHIRRVAFASNGNSTEAITASDIESMTETDLNNFYQNITQSLNYLDNTNVDGSIYSDISNVLDDLSNWGSMNEAQKETAVKELFGV